MILYLLFRRALSSPVFSIQILPENAGSAHHDTLKKGKSKKSDRRGKEIPMKESKNP